MSYKLYGLSGACSMAPHIVLHELGQDVDLHLLERKTNEVKSPEFLKINPNGSVPVLIDDGKVLCEGGAILIYLCDKHKSPLLPQEGWARAQALQWLMFCNATLHPAYGKTFWLPKNIPEGEAQTKAIEATKKQIQSLWDQVERHLKESGNNYLAGADVTVADILLAVIANWDPSSYSFGDKTKALLKAVSERPAYQQVIAEENITYKAAA